MINSHARAQMILLVQLVIADPPGMCFTTLALARTCALGSRSSHIVFPYTLDNLKSDTCPHQGRRVKASLLSIRSRTCKR